MVDGHGMYTVDPHVMSLSSCDLRAKLMTLFTGITTVISVVDIDCGSVWSDL